MPMTRRQGITNRSKAKSQNARKRGPTPGFPAKSNTLSRQLLPISQADLHSSRTTQYWVFDGKIFDLSGYGKFVDNVVQNFSDITVSQGVQSITFQGIGESQYGMDAGASASLSLTNTARLYVNYDAKFRNLIQSHQGTLGLELRW